MFKKFLAVSSFVFVSALATQQSFAQAHAAGCFVSPARLADDDIGGFLGSPAALVTLYPNGGLEMASRVRGLAGSSAEAVDPLLGLISQFNSTQKAALGSGLARVARSCVTVTPEYAQSIQEKVAAANSPEVTAAFLSALNEVQTAALGAGAGAGAGAAGGVGGGAAGSSGGSGGDSSVATTTGDFTIGSRSRSLVTNVTNITNENSGTSPF